MTRLWLLAIVALIPAGGASAQERVYRGEDVLTAAGLTPRSTVADAERLYGKDWRAIGEGGIEYLAAGSLADAWMTFRPGSFVYVDCGVTPRDLPDDVVAQLCGVARRTDWRQSLIVLKRMLRNGRSAPGLQTTFSADKPESGQKSGAGARDGAGDDDDHDFVQLARMFETPRYSVTVEVAPMITTRAGTSRAGVIVRWKAL